MAVAKRSVSVEAELMEWAEREAADAGVSVSRLITLSLERLRDAREAKRARDAAWAQWRAEYEAEHGAISAEELDEAARELGLE